MMVSEMESFLAVVKTGNLTKAANFLYITQPALTHRIRALEAELGYTLINRRPGIRSIELTPNGQAFALLAEQWISLWHVAQDLRNMDVVERFSIAGIESVNIFVMDPVCRKFMQHHPNIQLAIKNQYSDQAYQDVSCHLADLGIINNTQYSKNVNCVPAFQEEMVFACRAGSNYPTVVKPHDLDPKDSIFVPWSSSFEMWYQYWFSRKTPYKFFIQNVYMIKNYIAMDQNWSILPAMVGNWLLADPVIEIHPLFGGPEPRMNYFITNRDFDSPSIQEFYELIRQELSSQRGVSILF